MTALIITRYLEGPGLLRRAWHQLWIDGKKVRDYQNYPISDADGALRYHEILEGEVHFIIKEQQEDDQSE